MPKIKNILIFVAIGVALVLIYIFFIQPALSNQNQASLVSSTNTNNPGMVNTTTNTATDSSVTADFLTLLLNINTIKLDVSIFSNPAFVSLHDSSITLTPDATQGRPNPFAQFGAENVVVPTVPLTPVPPIPAKTPAKNPTISPPAKP